MMLILAWFVIGLLAAILFGSIARAGSGEV